MNAEERKALKGMFDREVSYCEDSANRYDREEMKEAADRIRIREAMLIRLRKELLGE